MFLFLLKLFDHPIYQESQRVAVYLSMSEEVQTHGILQNIFNAGKHCFIPRFESLFSTIHLNNIIIPGI